ncbi:Protein of unknown function (DUF2993) [Parafrankia irregularis]|uniref:DUF2993 domain-containing protein n=1 Tax=Parafrankia irregularis TaxID=795642 RepID=A0A0S4QH56_9ACTN|nr:MULTISPECIES: DUF2993 domain-containing protein [Parafrankia]MBE3203247.1 DUF2993 domain-containing protein [Parafrankia sp. CH37]CUU54104.1 Protein of unknown function (DUF2993) [Parafrankia irregularis]
MAAAPFVVIAALLVTDRLLVRVVEHRLTERFGCTGTFVGTRSVHIGGFPFLTQLAAGNLRTVTATAAGIGPAGRLTDVAVTFRDVRVPVWSVLLGRGRSSSLTVGSVSAAAVLRFGSDDRPVLAGSGGLLSRPLAAGSSAEPVLPPGTHLDSVEPMPGGLRVTVTIPGGVLAETGGRLCRG